MSSLANDTQTHSIAGRTVSFHTETVNEFMRSRSLMNERDILEDLSRSLEPDDVFYDVGGNVGMYTCVAALELERGAVVAFEPEPKNANRIEENLELNGLTAEVSRTALSDENGTVELALAGEDVGEGKHAIATDGETGTVQVDAAKVDTLVRDGELPPPTVVKVDVEGAELQALRGMKKTLERDCRLVYVEIHTENISHYGGTAEEVHSLLEDSRFEVDEVGRRGGQQFVRGSAVDSTG